MTRAAITVLGDDLLLGLLSPHALSSFSSLDSRSPSGRLLTLHLAVPYGGSRTSGTFPVRTDPHAIRPWILR
ncbi:hypothetical protein EDC04DRAFT_2706932 [Pisolithus marmoratus]|nr:hypothetical protein EDC04DRAFT_2706932 [Pisolithus marmoratus]